MSRIAAVILAGGRAERLGGINKALVEVGGRTLLDRVVDTLGRCEPILVAAGDSGFRPDGFVAVTDLASSYRGPLAGVAAAVAALVPMMPDYVLSVAVDTPFFPADFLERAAAEINEADVALAAFAGQPYPTNALWRFSAIADLATAVMAGTAPHSLKRLAASLGAVTLDYAPWSVLDPFESLNTREDLARARRRAAT